MRMRSWSISLRLEASFHGFWCAGDIEGGKSLVVVFVAQWRGFGWKGKFPYRHVEIKLIDA